MRIAIQGELGSNSHMAALELLAAAEVTVEIVPCAVSAIVFEKLMETDEELAIDGAVLPIENSLHGAVAEHYDLIAANPVRIVTESFLRIRFNLIAMPGVKAGDLKRVISHPVALSQCRRYLAAHPDWEVVPFYDTAGSVKHVMQMQLRATAGIAPELAAQEYGGEILARDLEDHAANFTRFHLICREDRVAMLPGALIPQKSSKMTVAFTVEHRPGTLVEALQLLASAGVDLTRIESRPVPGHPWEYVFYVEFRFAEVALAEAALVSLSAHCHTVKELGRYLAA
ncbi:prephenate dehydratase [Granulicella aggregans]|uniref:prephenate dehydratase n=1 Tax=Granulicella aggregans TaxID=474949 RepID=UPI0021E01806|nr:prephenate dehydratase domain-containing protein [Granulicella aggregans]